MMQPRVLVTVVRWIDERHANKILKVSNNDEELGVEFTSNLAVERRKYNL